MHPSRFLLFFFNDTATTEIYTLSLHDALPISNLDVAVGHPVAVVLQADVAGLVAAVVRVRRELARRDALQDRKSTRLNSSHVAISYAVFCLKKKKKLNSITSPTS